MKRLLCNCVVGVALLGFADVASAQGLCPSGAFVVRESGKVAAVDWVDYRPDQVHTRTVLTQSRAVDATIDIRADETAAHSSVRLTWPTGDAPTENHVRDLGAGAVYWSDFIPSSLEQVVRRARLLKPPVNSVSSTSLYKDSREEIAVQRIDHDDWVVDIHRKHYRILTDAAGCMLAASLPDYGVTIERVRRFDPALFPLSPSNAAPRGAPYDAREVLIPTPRGYVLAGTLTTPRGHTPTAAAVLITGLGPSNRNGGEAPWMPLRDLADALTRAGIAVLRVDDVGVGRSTGDHAPTTTYDEAKDVATEVAWLRSQHSVDRNRIALVGYSEGSLIALMRAAHDKSIAAVISLAGFGVPGPQLAREQIAAEVDNNPSIAPANRDAEIERQLAEPLTPREKVVLTIDPLAYAQQVRCPALVLQGGNDLTVPTRSAEKIAYAIRSNGNPDVAVRFIAGVGHSLLPDPNGLLSGAIYSPAFWVSPALLAAMTQWAKSHLGR